MTPKRNVATFIAKSLSTVIGLSFDKQPGFIAELSLKELNIEL
jgi:hypothetical protein